MTKQESLEKLKNAISDYYKIAKVEGGSEEQVRETITSIIFDVVDEAELLQLQRDIYDNSGSNTIQTQTFP